MKTKNFLLSGILGIAFAGAVLTGCKKDPLSSATSTSDYSAAQDDANASAATNDSKNISNSAIMGNSSQYGPAHTIQSLYTSNCSVKWDSTNNTTDSIVVTFGNGNTPVYCLDERYRQGSIIVFWPKSNGNNLRQAYFDSANVLTMTFRNYAVGSSQNNMIGITGVRADTNKGKNALGEQNWSFHAALTLKYSTGDTATWISNRHNTLVSVGGVYYYEITGAAYGLSNTGATYSLSTEYGYPLYFNASPWWNGGCKYLEGGIISINITPKGNSSTTTFTITYGNNGSIGSCSSTATVSVNGVTKTVTLL